MPKTSLYTGIKQDIKQGMYKDVQKGHRVGERN